MLYTQIVMDSLPKFSPLNPIRAFVKVTHKWFRQIYLT